MMKNCFFYNKLTVDVGWCISYNKKREKMQNLKSLQKKQYQ